MAKEPKTAKADEAKADEVEKTEPVADEPKVGKVEARLAALEAYIANGVKTLGWPEFKG
ncbi:hypothetical protein OIU35_31655 [Boseaceae bacterium BT-24-1]|nr:hypothetical protein [Boseaceae bacterium BT-24-1]